MLPRNESCAGIDAIIEFSTEALEEKEVFLECAGRGKGRGFKFGGRGRVSFDGFKGISWGILADFHGNQFEQSFVSLEEDKASKVIISDLDGSISLENEGSADFLLPSEGEKSNLNNQTKLQSVFPIVETPLDTLQPFSLY